MDVYFARDKSNILIKITSLISLPLNNVTDYYLEIKK